LRARKAAIQPRRRIKAATGLTPLRLHSRFASMISRAAFASFPAAASGAAAAVRAYYYYGTARAVTD